LRSGSSPVCVIGSYVGSKHKDRTIWWEERMEVRTRSYFEWGGNSLDFLFLAIKLAKFLLSFIGGNHQCHSFRILLVDKIWEKPLGWMSRHLSIGARLVLLKCLVLITNLFPFLFQYSFKVLFLLKSVFKSFLLG
jgi:hypothetical protein